MHTQIMTARIRLALLALAVAVVALLGASGKAWAAPSPTSEVEALRVSNISDSSVTISWTTSSATTGHIVYGTATPDQTATDVRGADVALTTHFVVISGLTPSTSYVFDVVSAGLPDTNGGAHYQFATGPSLMPAMPDTAYGRVVLSDGTTPVEGTLVYLNVQDADGSGSGGTSTSLAALTNAQGEWVADLGSTRVNDASAAFIPMCIMA
ncbi:MAG: fibronectin type III domain-containing protein [Chloroflexaceae bacterium]|nr:fibronectin type III domain-containing protein [Chloroflexaceae bacterium]